MYSVITLLWMYLTPIFYPVSILKEKTTLALTLNPMYHFITYLRELVLYGTIPSYQDNIICFLIGLTFLIFGLFVFIENKINLFYIYNEVFSFGKYY